MATSEGGDDVPNDEELRDSEEKAPEISPAIRARRRERSRPSLLGGLHEEKHNVPYRRKSSGDHDGMHDRKEVQRRRRPHSLGGALRTDMSGSVLVRMCQVTLPGTEGEGEGGVERLQKKRKEDLAQIMDGPSSGKACQRLITNVRSFIPEFLFKSSPIQNLGRPLLSSVHELHSTCMIADLSGFTKKSEELCADGSMGIGELSLLINDCFARIIHVIDGCGGDVFKYAGDALLVAWTCDEEDEVKENALRAVQCGLELVALTFPDMSLHIGIATGPINSFVIGDHLLEWNCLVCGKVLQNMGKAEEAAGSCEVVIDTACHAFVKDACTLEQVGDANDPVYKVLTVDTPKDSVPLFHGSAGDGDHFQQITRRVVHFVPPVVDLTTKISDEIRNISVIFCKLDGPVVNGLMEGLPHRDQLQLCFMRILRVLKIYGGMMYKFFVDDKGCILMVSFGTPNFSHNDDSARAVGCALALHSELKVMNFDTYMGLTSGNAFCGTQGVEERKEYTILGDVVNLSARLMAHMYKEAKGDVAAVKTLDGSEIDSFVLCDETTYSFVKSTHEFAPTQSITVKGKDHPVDVHRCVKALSAADARKHWNNTACWGRDNELSMLQNAVLDQATKNAGKSFVLRGISGIGKSTILNRVCNFAALTGVFVAASKVSPTESRTPYSAFSSIYWLIVMLDGKKKSSPKSESMRMKSETGGRESKEAGGVVENLGSRSSGDLISLKDSLEQEGAARNLRRRSSHHTSALLQIEVSNSPSDVMDEFVQALNGTIVSDGVKLTEGDVRQVLQYITKDSANLKSAGKKDDERLGEILPLVLEASFDTNLIKSKVINNNLLVAIDDAHLMDSCSWDIFVSFIGIFGQYVMSILAMRPMAESTSVYSNDMSEEHWAVKKIRETNGGAIIDVEPLDEKSISTMLVGQFGDLLWPKDTVQQLYEETGGVPLICMEVARGLHTNCKMNGEASVTYVGSVGLGGEDSKDVSALLQKAIVARMDSLSKNEQAVLKRASVIGPIFAYAMLKDLVPHSLSRMKNQVCGLDLAILNLIRLEFIQLQDPMNKEYTFTHDIICKVTYGLILPQDQQYLHKRVAMWLEDRHSDDLRPYFVSLMYHYSKSKVMHKAIKYAVHSVKMATIAGAMAEASAMVDQALLFTQEASDTGKKTAAQQSASKRKSMVASPSFQNKLKVDDSPSALNSAVGQNKPNGRLRASADGNISEQRKSFTSGMMPESEDVQAYLEMRVSLICELHDMVTTFEEQSKRARRQKRRGSFHMSDSFDDGDAAADLNRLASRHYKEHDRPKQESPFTRDAKVKVKVLRAAVDKVREDTEKQFNLSRTEVDRILNVAMERARRSRPSVSAKMGKPQPIEGGSFRRFSSGRRASVKPPPEDVEVYDPNNTSETKACVLL